VAEPTLHPTLLCRAHLHHRWVPARSEDGGQYLRCANCGKDKSDVNLKNLDGKDREGAPRGFITGG
jgi:hypothetical protein